MKLAGGPDMRLDHAWQCLVKVGRFGKKSPPRRLWETIWVILERFVFPFGFHFAPFALHFALQFCMPFLSAIPELRGAIPGLWGQGSAAWAEALEHTVALAELGMWSHTPAAMAWRGGLLVVFWDGYGDIFVDIR